MTSSVDAHPCPVCGDQDRLRHLCVVDGFTVYACATCQAEHAWPVPTAQELKAYYDRAEWFEGGEKGGYENYDIQTDRTADLVAKLLDNFAKGPERAVLDLGCGYGTHLAVAAQRGWQCFGVELSDHARGIAQKRLGESAYIVESTADLFARRFDLILLLDVVEHLPSPYQTFYELFALGAIAPDTVVVITTPNAGAAEARLEPAAWRYRHPPSHLVYYTVAALTYLLRRLRFSDVQVCGLSPAESVGGDMSRSAGLMATASGSDFQNFMHERYVPGTWSKIAAYEHVPRYDLARTLAAGKTVLDFGCGTGYGAALLAEVAKHVTGIDIDESALTWARQTHRTANLAFQRHDDLGAELPAVSFDLVTCFEMIEHVDFSTQQRAVASMARLLRDDGLLIISTPNPEVTKLYGANPYHLREMTEAEFRDLLNLSFPYVQVLRQYVKPGVIFSQGEARGTVVASPMSVDAGEAQPAVAFIALCGRHPVYALSDCVFFDDAANYVGDFVDQERNIQVARGEGYRQGARAAALNDAVAHVNQAKVEIQNQFNMKTMELEALRLTREEELISPRFLAKRLLRATATRLWSIVSGERKYRKD